MKMVVTYNSKTGFTKQYAEWIGEALGCEVIQFKKLKSVAEYDLVIHGGWVMGGMITGLQNIQKLNPKQLVAFGVGFTEDDSYVETVKTTNQLQDIPTYYFLGGTHPKKMNFFMRTMVKAATGRPVEDVDLSKKESIQPLVEYVKSMSEN